MGFTLPAVVESFAGKVNKRSPNTEWSCVALRSKLWQEIFTVFSLLVGRVPLSINNIKTLIQNMKTGEIRWNFETDIRINIYIYTHCIKAFSGSKHSGPLRQGKTPWWKTWGKKASSWKTRKTSTLLSSAAKPARQWKLWRQRHAEEYSQAASDWLVAQHLLKKDFTQHLKPLWLFWRFG